MLWIVSRPLRHDQPADPHLADVHDFLELHELDAERGVLRPLEEWLRRFPGSEAAIAAEWLELQRASTPEDAPRARIESGEGRTLVGPYELLRELGRGGQGAVHLARDTRLKREVALKILAGSFDGLQSITIERLRREAEVIARLDHPSLCAILDADLGASPPWIAMRLVPGETLACVLARARQGGAAQSGGMLFPPANATQVRAVCALFERAARALHAAHEAGVVHRDFKPGNLMVDPDGRPVVLDFGMAEDRTSDRQLTVQGDVHGTPDYMAPEQAEGRRDEVDGRADVWALATSLHEALTLERPWSRPTLPATFQAILSEPAPRAGAANAAVPRDLEVVLATALEKDPAGRYGSALEFAEDLRRVREFEPIHARPAGPLLRFARWTRRHPRIAAATVGAFLALSAGLGAALHLLARERDALSNSLGRHLAQRSAMLAQEDSARAHILGVEAVQRSPNWLSRGALSQALDGNFLERRFLQPPPARSCVALALDAAGAVCALAFDDGTVRIVRLSDGVDVAMRRFEPPPVALAFDEASGELCLAQGSGARIVGASDLADRSVVELGVEVQHVARAAGRWIIAAGAWRALVDGAPVDLAPLRGRARRVEHAGGRVLLVDDGATLLQAAQGGTMVVGWSTPRCLAATLAPRGDLLALSRADGTLEALRVDAGASSVGSARLDPPATTLAFGLGGERLAVASRRGEEGRAWILDLRNFGLQPLVGHGGRAVQALCATSDGSRVWSAGHDNSLCLWDFATGREIARSWSPKRTLELLATADGRRILERSSGAQVQVHHAGSRSDALLLGGLRGAVRMAGFAGASGAERAHAVDATGELRVWDATDGRELGRAGGGSVLRAAARDAARTHVATYDAQAQLVVASALDGAVAWRRAHEAAPDAERRDAAHQASLDLASGGARAVVVDQRGAWLMSAGGSSSKLDDRDAHGACFDASGALVLTFGADDLAVVHDAVDGRRLAEHAWKSRGAARGAKLACALPGGGWALYCAEGKLRFVDARAGDLHEPLAVFDTAALRAPGETGPLLIVGRFGGRALRVQAPAGGPSVWPSARPAASIVDADMSQDGSIVAAVCGDGSLVVSSAQDGSPWMVRSLPGAQGTCCALSKDGARVLVAQSDGMVRIYDRDPLPAALRRLPRSLDEWEVKGERELAAPLRFEPLVGR
jgi:serine/threonine protein kinase